ncbi:Nramp family divalent metal transporter [Lutimonas zeaxanthinifaciens]|uniref:Nramp family divalent metal transporter n=1 Tax=Lutimonas zeaxanthinifaciens TaxID=3060215 RepID=UPI00265C9E16|nr:Nramp family divalent metal transporter [Lutimonas sp. YSD2104]WKK64986.1 Nramp family divalent metal transporter [Lutimonas sp. YSD2104]
MNGKFGNVIKNLGPGLLFAGAAIGVSHLVQSTRAGADFGFGLLWALLLVNLFKYPFFQFGPRYAAATGESLIDGYKRLGTWVLILYFILTFLTMFTIQAAVTIVTAGLAQNLFGLTSNLTIWSLVITLISLFILLIGKYHILDKTMKIIISVLAISSVVAVSIAAFKTNESFSLAPQFPQGAIEVAFLIAFLGWMPAPLDISTWHSLWAIEKQKDTIKDFNTKRALTDFNIGYISTVFLGICFMSLGAFVMFYSTEEISQGASGFASQLISLYTENLGTGAAIFIGVAALTTMFSTTLTTLDASPRAMAKSTEILFNKKHSNFYLIWIFTLSVGTLIILSYFKANMITFVKIATIISFLTAPFYAVANLLLVTGKHMPEQAKPSFALRILSYSGIVFLVFFSILYLTSI